MKVYISADMEGVTGVSHWDEVDHAKPQYSYFQKQMSKEHRKRKSQMKISKEKLKRKSQK